MGSLSPNKIGRIAQSVRKGEEWNEERTHVGLGGLTVLLRWKKLILESIHEVIINQTGHSGAAKRQVFPL